MRPIIMRLLDGRLVDVTNLQDDEIDIHQIAHALSLLCRYAGQVPEFYSVAQHCVIVAEVAKEMGMSTQTQLCALLHDAAEAFIVDLPSPIKRHDYFYRELEAQVLHTIGVKFNIRFPSVVHNLDEMVAKAEQRDLQNVSWDRHPELDALKIVPMSSLEAEIAFLAKFFELVSVCPHCCGAGYNIFGECKFCGEVKNDL